ncbi:DUF1729-domain-containing protein [Aspergillus heteromorphus CBS 117.55]|uniref:fatty-acyl-CoA synthase system n=1 Tax=Aspergillus heteromorphus CBS 117.55 TaxID=1448321 RepID=A0A317V4B6_9EURO|nr:DUF1729-domain-containing protein [Aspergillus heteromorphus CBS 117.55]PWY69124.1 DUF1729-domain-containing protein [Aspergillus heteromorphus CBS 117.55]
MPFDGVLLPSRILLTAKEAYTSPSVKQLLVAGAVTLTCQSEKGRPICGLATRAALLWKEFDQRFFSIPDPALREHTLHTARDEIKRRLNRDSARPWFAVDATGHNIELENLTYRQVLRRLVALTFLSRERWGGKAPIFTIPIFHAASPEISTLDSSFGQALGAAADKPLHPENILRLLQFFRLPKQKPVSLIPRLDEYFETWFKKDPFWQAEDVDAVMNLDAQRTFILLGPVLNRFIRGRDW